MQYRIPRWVWLIVISAALAVSVALRIEPSGYHWPQGTDHGAVQSVFPAAYLTSGQQPALLWRPQDANTPMVYASLPILPYSDLDPQRWQAAQAKDDNFHLVWREQDGRLRSVLLNGTNGETIRGPITLATDAAQDFALLAQPDGTATVYWINAQTQQLNTATLDQGGRNGPSQRAITGRVTRAAAVADRDGTPILAWLAAAQPNTWDLYFQTADAPIYTLSLETDEFLASFALGLDDAHTYIIWGVANVYQPDMERVYVLTFPTGQPETGRVFELRLPAQFDPGDSPASSSLETGPVAALDDVQNAAPLRWPRPASGQNNVLALGVSVRSEDGDGWRPTVIYLNEGTPQGYQVIATQPADVESPVLAVAGSDVYAAWTGLQDGVPHLFTASTAGRGLVKAAPTHANLAARTLASLGIALPVALLWMALPLGLLLRFEAEWWAFPLATALYGAGKVFWPRALLVNVPPLLDAVGAGTPLGAGIALLGCGLLVTSAARLIISGQRADQHWREWLGLALVDALLTWAIFGPNVIGGG